MAQSPGDQVPGIESSVSVKAGVHFNFDSYPSKSCVQDLNLFKSDFGSENAYVKDKMHIFQFFKAASLRSAALFKMCLT